MSTDSDAPEKTIRLRRWSWEPDSVVEVQLRLTKFSDTEWLVMRNGEPLGSVSSYRGSLDRKAGRLRIPGKPRTLWAACRVYGYVSRAEAIRYLLQRVPQKDQR